MRNLVDHGQSATQRLNPGYTSRVTAKKNLLVLGGIVHAESRDGILHPCQAEWCCVEGTITVHEQSPYPHSPLPFHSFIKQEFRIWWRSCPCRSLERHPKQLLTVTITCDGPRIQQSPILYLACFIPNLPSSLLLSNNHIKFALS